TAAGGGVERTRLDQANGQAPPVVPDAPTLRRPGRLGSRHGSGDPGIRSLGRLRTGPLALGRRRATGSVSARPVVLRTLRSHASDPISPRPRAALPLPQNNFAKSLLLSGLPALRSPHGQ